MEKTLSALPVKRLVAVLKQCAGGNIGFDPFRDERTKSKDGLVSYILASYTEEQINAALAGSEQAVSGEAVSAPVDQGAVAQQIASLFATLAGSAVNESRVREIVGQAVTEALESQAPQRVEYHVTRLDGSSHKVDGHVRAEFSKVLRAAGAGLNILLVGPAGCGKTHLAHQVAEALGRDFASISCTAGMSESSLQGWLLPADGGAFDYQESDFVRIYENGGVFLFDEVDAADPNTLLFVNQALANGGFHLPQRKGRTYVKRHADFVCIAAANTFGTGANTVYAGRERLDESTLDRFRAGVISLDYDTRFEEQAVHPSLLAWGWAVRKNIRECRLSRVLSTRFLLDGTKLIAAGADPSEVRDTFFHGWKADDRAKVDVSV